MCKQFNFRLFRWSLQCVSQSVLHSSLLHHKHLTLRVCVRQDRCWLKARRTNGFTYLDLLLLLLVCCVYGIPFLSIALHSPQSFYFQVLCWWCKVTQHMRVCVQQVCVFLPRHALPFILCSVMYHSKTSFLSTCRSHLCFCSQHVFNSLLSSFSFPRTHVTSSGSYVCWQWVEILESIQHIIHWCDIDAVDALMSSDVALRLGALYEAAALLRSSRDPPGTAVYKWWNWYVFFDGMCYTICKDFKCVHEPTTSRLSLTHHANKSSCWVE